MKTVSLLLVMLVMSVAGHAGIWSINTSPVNPGPTDTILVITEYYVARQGDYNKYASTMIVGSEVDRLICMEKVRTDLVAAAEFFFDTVKLSPYGSLGGYWFYFTYQKTDTTLGCDSAYNTTKDSLLIGSDPTIGVMDLSSSLQGYFTLYPNPVSTNDVTLSILPSSSATVRLTDVTGRSVPFRRSGATLYLDALPPGLYLLHIRDGERRYTTKLIKQ